MNRQQEQQNPWKCFENDSEQVRCIHSKSVAWCFTPSQPLRLYPGECIHTNAERERETERERERERERDSERE